MHNRSKSVIIYNLELTAQQKQAAQLMQQLIRACWKSKKFKSKLIASPVKTIEKVTAKRSQLPKGVRIEVEDQSNPSIIYLNIPAKPK